MVRNLLLLIEECKLLWIFFLLMLMLGTHWPQGDDTRHKSVNSVLFKITLDPVD